MEKIIKGAAGFEITLKDDQYSFTYDRVSENELAALMIVREIFKYSKEQLKESLKQVKGKDLNMIKDRMGKITTSEYSISMMIESIIGEFLSEEKINKNPVSTEQLVG